MDVKQIFPLILQELIYKSGISVNEIAKQSGISKRQIFNYLDGTHQPTLDKFYKLMKVLGAEANEIAGKISDKLKES